MNQRNTVVAKLWLCGLLLTAAGCGRGHTIFGNLLLSAPAITDTLPATVTGASWLVHGTRDPGTAVYIVFSGSSSNGTLLAAADQNSTWSGTVNLQQGDNTFHLYAATTSLQSANSPDYALGRVPLPPGVTAPASVSASAGTAPISGTKEAGTSISVTDQNGVTTTYVQTDNNTDWTAQVAVADGNNTLTFQASNGKYTSTPVQVIIFGSPLMAPIFTFKSPTNNPNQTIQGQRPLPADQAAPLWLSINGGTPVQVITGSQTPQWNAQISLSSGDGNYTVTAYEIDPNTNIAGPSFTAVIVLKTVAPHTPSISSPTLPWQDVGNASFVITGSTDAGSYLCVATTSQGPCVVTGPTSGGAFSVTNTLQPGSNTLYISARDNAGNISTEVQGTVYLDSPPVMTSPNPADGAVVVGLSVNTNVIVAPASADSTRASADITSVTVSLDGGSPVSDTNTNGVWSSTVQLPSTTATGSQHTITTVATNAVGGTTTYVSHFVYSDGSAVWVSKDPTGYDDQLPSAAMDANGTLHVVWQSNCGQTSACKSPCATAPDIFYSARDTSGVWSTIALASAPASAPASAGDQLSVTPAIAVDPNTGHVHVVWAETGTVNGKGAAANNQLHGIVHRIYTPKSSTWSSILPVSSTTSTYDDQTPAIAIDANGLVHVAWSRFRDQMHSDIYYARYVNGAWSTELQVTPSSGAGSDATQGRTTIPSIAAAASGHAQIAWQQCEATPDSCTSGSNQNRDIWLREVSSATALGFGPVLVSNATKGSTDGDSTFPSIAIDPCNIAWVFWLDTSSLAINGVGANGLGPNVWYRNYSAGTPLTNQYNQVTVSNSNAGGPAGGPIIVALGPAASGAAPLGIAWSQLQADGNYNIWARIGSTSNTTSLDTTVYQASTSPQLAQQPAMAVDATGNLYVAWTDIDSGTGTATGTADFPQVYFEPVPVQ